MSDSGRTSPDPAEAAGARGRVLAGRFRVERGLGRGGMGEVLLAHDTLLDRRVALKHLRDDGSRDARERRAAVLKEARRASQVNDRRIAAIHDVLDLGDELLIVMEYVEGETLRQRLLRPLPLDQFWELSRQCVEALGAAHEHGVIHRDIKPENLMVTRSGEIKVLDFGIAWRTRPAGVASTAAPTATVELHGTGAGTPLYMAPEAHYGGAIDARTDIFSLGVVFYEMLTAQHPFTTGPPEGLIDRMMNTPPRPVSELNPAVTPPLATVIGRMLARDPAQRFASCEDLGEALASARSGVAAAVVATPPRSTAAARRRAVATTAWALGALAIAVAALATWRALAAPRLPAERRLAILPPVTPGATDDFGAYALGATELLANRLMRYQNRPDFQMSTFSESYSEQLATAADARKALGANLVLVPTLEQRENRLRGRLELREPLRNRSLGARQVDVPLAEPFAFADSLYHAAIGLLRLPMRAQTAQADVGIRGAGTLRFLLQGIGRRRVARSAEDGARALADFETAYRTEPDPAAPRAWLSAAQTALFNATRDTMWAVRAEASAREALSLDSSRSEPHLRLAYALTALKQHAEALEQYRIASALDPTDDEAWRLWGRSWMRLGQPEEERKVYEAAIARRPHAFKPRWWLASWEFNNGHVAEAIVAFREMVRRTPDNFNGYASLGGLLLLQGQYDAAIDTLRIAVGLRPGATAYSNLGTAYFNSGRLTQAVDAYNQAFQFDDATYETWMNLGDAYYWLRNRPDQARNAYRQALRLAREEMAARAQRGSSPDPMIPAHLASTLPKLGEPDSAKAMLREALALDSLNSRVQYQAALTQWQLGDRGVAMDWLRRAVAGGFPVAWLRDSPVHRDWHADPGFRALLATVAPAANARSPGKGGTR